MKKLSAFIKEHFAMFFGASVGFIIALLFIILGFWRTMLILLFTSVGAVIGGIPAVRSAIVEWADRIYEKLSK